jgi:hypothetical protein
MDVIQYIYYKQVTTHQSLLNLTIGNEDGVNIHEILFLRLLTGSLILHDTLNLQIVADWLLPRHQQNWLFGHKLVKIAP